jgi:hypothetical protein
MKQNTLTTQPEEYKSKDLTPFRTFTLTLTNGDGSPQKHEVKTYCMERAIGKMRNDIESNWHDKTMRVIAAREGSMFTPEEEAELKREKDEWRSR